MQNERGLLSALSDIIWRCWAEWTTVHKEITEGTILPSAETAPESTGSSQPEIQLNVGQRLSLLTQCRLSRQIAKDMEATDSETNSASILAGDNSNEELFAPFSIGETMLHPK